MFDIKPAQERLPAAVHLPGIRVRARGPQPDRPGGAIVRQVIDGELDEGALDDRQFPLVACPGAAGLQLPVPSAVARPASSRSSARRGPYHAVSAANAGG